MSDAPAIPPFLTETLATAYDGEAVKRILAGFDEARERPVTLRANALISSVDSVTAALDAASIPYARIPWYADALVLGDGVVERDVWALDIYKNGSIYLQSLSSMLPPLALGPKAGADILDMCAAPGGKTSQMAALQASAHITACELSTPRAEKLAHNLNKLGAVNVQVMRTDARKLDEFFSFDQILLDAPCTGTGTFRAGDERAARRITPQLLAKVTRSQRALIDRALTVLKPGGTLLYSTCSILPQENEGQIKAILAAKRHRACEIAPVELDDAIPCLPNGMPGTITVAPTREFEGFFIAKIKKGK